MLQAATTIVGVLLLHCCPFIAIVGLCYIGACSWQINLAYAKLFAVSKVALLSITACNGRACVTLACYDLLPMCIASSRHASNVTLYTPGATMSRCTLASVISAPLQRAMSETFNLSASLDSS